MSYLLFHISVKELHREFLRAGSDVMQTFTFYASDDKLGNRGNKAAEIGVQFVYLYVKLVNLEGDIEQWFCYNSYCESQLRKNVSEIENASVFM